MNEDERKALASKWTTLVKHPLQQSSQEPTVSLAQPDEVQESSKTPPSMSPKPVIQETNEAAVAVSGFPEAPVDFKADLVSKWNNQAIAQGGTPNGTTLSPHLQSCV